MVRKRKSGENVIVGNDFEEVRPCYTRKGGDVCAKLIYAVLSKYNPALPNDKYNDLQKVDHDNKHLPRVGFTEAEVDFIFGISTSSNPTMKKKYIRNAISKLVTEKITVKKADGGIIACPIFTLFDYTPSDKNNTLVAEINYNLLELVLDFKNMNKLYTTVSLNDIRLLSSDYSIKIYIYCQRYLKFKNDDSYVLTVPVDKLRELLGVSKGYSSKDFNTKILDKCTQEITQRTTFNVTWERVICGRKITDYKFFVKSKTPIKIRKHYEAGFACVNGIDSSLINVDNAETVTHLSKMGVNKAQLIEAIKMGTTYLKYVTKEIDNQYKKLVEIDRNVSYGALFWGAIKGWLNYEKWAKEHQEDINKDKERLIELSNIKLKKIEETEEEKAEKEKRIKQREVFRNAIPIYKNFTDEELDEIINKAEKMQAEKQVAKEAEEAKKKEAEEADEAKTVKGIVVDSFVRANFDVNRLSLSPFKDFFFDEQKRFGFDDFSDFVQYVKSISVQ